MKNQNKKFAVVKNITPNRATVTSVRDVAPMYMDYVEVDEADVGERVWWKEVLRQEEVKGERVVFSVGPVKGL